MPVPMPRLAVKLALSAGLAAMLLWSLTLDLPRSGRPALPSVPKVFSTVGAGALEQGCRAWGESVESCLGARDEDAWSARF